MQQRLDPADFAFAGQEHQHAAIGFATACITRSASACSKRVSLAQRVVQPAVSTGKARPSDVRIGAFISRGHGRRIERGGHHQQDQIVAQRARDFEAQRQPRSALSERSWNSSKITAPMPESSGSDWIIRVRIPSVTTSIRVARRYFRLATDPVADGLAPVLAQGLRHPLGGGARGKAARFQHEDAAVGETRRAAFPAARRWSCPRPGGACNTARPAAAQGVDQRRNDAVDGKGLAHASGYEQWPMTWKVLFHLS